MYSTLCRQQPPLKPFDTSYSITMDAPTIRPKFLKNGHELGLVAVGFSGGQVSNIVSIVDREAIQLTRHVVQAGC